MLPIRAAWFVVLCLLCGHASANSDEGYASAKYIEAQSLIAGARYGDALSVLRQLQAKHPTFSKISAVQTRIAVLQEHRDAADVMPEFMHALDLRDRQQSSQAINVLSGLLVLADNTPLVDDALYLKAYIEVMDLYRFEDARASIAMLWERFPDTAYMDSAAYLDAIALEQSGRTDQARLALRVLRERHTAISLPFGFRMPAGNVLSRYWFERADQRLTILQQRGDVATRLRGKQQSGNGSIVIDVEAEGQQLSLTLQPSPVIKNVQWTDQNLNERSPPAIAVYTGVVTGEPSSWARVVMQGQSVSGMVSVNGLRSTLQPDQLIGTIDYYKAGTRNKASHETDQFDYLNAPIRKAGIQARMVQQQSSTRLVSLSVVVDAAFDDYYGGQGMVQALNNINMADGIYREQGIALTIDKVQTLNGDNSPVVTDDTGTLESILNSFRDYRIEQKTLYNDSVLVYLFTGADTVDRTLGLAWIDTLCRVDGYDVGVTTPSSYANVLTAHELGHSFGALHDSDTACSADSNKIMWPRISANTQAEFSTCSSSNIGLARSSACLGNAIDLQLSASIEQDGVSIRVGNADALMPVTARVHIEAVDLNIDWPAECVAQTPSSADCVIANLAAASTYEIDLGLADGSSDGLINAQASLDEIHDHEPVNNAVSIDLASGLITQSIAFFDSVAPTAPQANSSGGSGRLQTEILFLFLSVYLVRRRELFGIV